MNYEAVLFYKQKEQTEEGTPQTPADIGATSRVEVTLSPRPESVSLNNWYSAIFTSMIYERTVSVV